MDKRSQPPKMEFDKVIALMDQIREIKLDRKYKSLTLSDQQCQTLAEFIVAMEGEGRLISRYKDPTLDWKEYITNVFRNLFGEGHSESELTALGDAVLIMIGEKSPLAQVSAAVELESSREAQISNQMSEQVSQLEIAEGVRKVRGRIDQLVNRGLRSTTLFVLASIGAMYLGVRMPDIVGRNATLPTDPEVKPVVRESAVPLATATPLQLNLVATNLPSTPTTIPTQLPELPTETPTLPPASPTPTAEVSATSAASPTSSVPEGTTSNADAESLIQTDEPTSTVTSTNTPSATPSNTATNTSTNTPPATPTYVPSATNTSVPSATSTLTPTQTVVPASATFTSTPTETDVPITATFTNTPTFTASPTNTPSVTPTVPPPTFTPDSTVAPPTSTAETVFFPPIEPVDTVYAIDLFAGWDGLQTGADKQRFFIYDLPQFSIPDTAKEIYINFKLQRGDKFEICSIGDARLADPALYLQSYLSTYTYQDFNERGISRLATVNNGISDASKMSQGLAGNEFSSRSLAQMENLTEIVQNSGCHTALIWLGRNEPEGISINEFRNNVMIIVRAVQKAGKVPVVVLSPGGLDEDRDTYFNRQRAAYEAAALTGAVSLNQWNMFNNAGSANVSDNPTQIIGERTPGQPAQSYTITSGELMSIGILQFLDEVSKITGQYR